MTNLNDTTAADALKTESLPGHTHSLGLLGVSAGNTSSNPEAAAVAAAAVGPVASTAPALADADGNPTEYQLVLWAQEHGRKIKVVEVDGKLVCFKHPSRAIVEAANDVLMKTKKPSKYSEVIMSNCQLNFIAETKADDELYYALVNRVDEIITSKVATLKN
ncbi:hypothetical protein GCM10023185_15550 [Hymenobacter saemangeumensis]|uniref:Uncharacterized protein n=1 Tax=Hymenobacter saemangeumensis TaxID=1084522 RepID=A0ABP8I9M2_9BACT